MCASLLKGDYTSLYLVSRLYIINIVFYSPVASEVYDSLCKLNKIDTMQMN